MRLRPDLIPAWVRWQQPEGDTSSWEPAAAALAAKALGQPEQLEMRRISLDTQGQIQASLFLSWFQPGVLTFGPPRFSGAGAAALPELIGDAQAWARSQGARLQCRLLDIEAMAPTLAALPGLGARLSHRRVEFWAPLADLPDETGTPLQWSSLAPAGKHSFETVTEVLHAAGVGDPDWDPADDAAELLKSYLAEEALIGTPDCVQIASLDGELMGIAIAQVNPGTRWSRITYMGMLPAFRGRGLGKWIHRHGFEMLRAQGGVEYHGGTVAGNHAMEALFLSQGCRPERRLQEWHWD